MSVSLQMYIQKCISVMWWFLEMGSLGSRKHSIINLCKWNLHNGFSKELDHSLHLYILYTWRKDAEKYQGVSHAQAREKTLTKTWSSWHFNLGHHSIQDYWKISVLVKPSKCAILLSSSKLTKVDLILWVWT